MASKQRKECVHTHEARYTRFYWQMIIMERFNCETDKLRRRYTLAWKCEQARKTNRDGAKTSSLHMYIGLVSVLRLGEPPYLFLL